jgi:GntR family transcriptional regulator
MAIWFDIDAQSGVPIFKQIIDQIKRAIATGMLKPDEQLPTVRELAEEHSINPNTVAKAYQNLELLGLVYTRPGVRGGTFIEREIAAELHKLELARFQEALRKLVQEGHFLGLEAAELNRQFQAEVAHWYSANPLPARPLYEGKISRPARKLSTNREAL